MPLGYECRCCGIQKPRPWTKGCPNCGLRANILTRNIDLPGAEMAEPIDGQAISLSDVQAKDVDRLPTMIVGLDKVLNGGIVTRSMTLVCGSPGSGKSTLLLAMLQSLAKQREKVLYITGEESLIQMKLRADRLGKFPASMIALYETDIDAILDTIEEKQPSVVVIDSIQMIDVGEDFGAGSTASIRIAIHQFMKCAKAENGPAIFIIGHITKGGAIGGPRALEHMVDTSLFFKSTGKSKIRFLQCNFKNRFGPTPIEASFLMAQKGLLDCSEEITEKTDPALRKYLEKKGRAEEGDEEDNEEDNDISDTQAYGWEEEKKESPKKTKPVKPAKPKEPKPSLAETLPIELTPQRPSKKKTVKAKQQDLEKANKPVKILNLKLPKNTDAILAEACDSPDCKGQPGRACTSQSGIREAGFHESRIAKAKSKPVTVPPAIIIETPETPQKPLTAKPRLKKKQAPDGNR